MNQEHQRSEPRSSGPEHLGFIDALRGWAFVGVLLVHVQTIQQLPSLLATWARPANYGVQLFFVVSALTLFMSYESREKRDRRPLAAFFVRRLFRIAPLFWLAIPAYLLFSGSGPRPAAPDGIGTAQIVTTMFFLHGWHPGTINALVPGGWSIAVEMNFYLILPFCFHLLKTLRAALATSALVLVASIAASVGTNKLLAGSFPEPLLHDFTYYWFPRQVAVFFLGFVLFFLIKRGKSAPFPMQRQLPELALVLLAALAVAGGRIPVAYYAFSVGFVLLALGLSARPVPYLVNPLMRYIGKVSFSAYITHFMVLDVLGKPIANTFSAASREAHPTGVFLLIFAAVALGTVLVSSLTYRFIEEPGQDLGRLILQRLGLGAAADARVPAPAPLPVSTQ